VEGVIHAIGAGCDVLLEDVDDGLAMIPDDSYDQVVLSETLQTIKRPKELLQQILRVADEAVITFPNFACLDVRCQLLFGGRMPKGKDIPYEWYETPNIHLFTLKDFVALCQQEGIAIQELVCQAETWIGRLLLVLGLKNLAASKVVVRVKRQTGVPVQERE
jgi:homoserine O-acetyltransferase